MTTNFFTLLDTHIQQGIINLTIKKTEGGALIVIVNLKRSLNKEKAGPLPTLNIKTSAQELDAQFFTAITAPVRSSQEFLINAEQYQQAIKQAGKASRPAPAKQATEAVDPATKKYEAQLKKVEELLTQKKIGEALMQLPKVSEFPQFKDAIEKRAEEIRAMDDRFTLF